MDIATLIGVVLGIGLIILAVLIHEGVAGLTIFYNTEAFLVVIGGTFCATLINYSLSQVIGVMAVAKNVLFSKKEDPQYIISTFVNLAHKAKREGLIALEQDVNVVKNNFMKRGIQMVVDGQDQDFIRTMLETEIGFIKERHKIGQEIFVALGTYAPAFGIIGTVLGMILMLKSISDVEEVPYRMSIALTSAFFGLGSGYLFFLPIAGKLRRRSEEEILINELIIRGILLLQVGANPRLIEENLKAYIEPAVRKRIRVDIPSTTTSPQES